ncbi:hypothetical protein TRFO_04009 [Tritrichomonas foetus]|uniref:Clathrin/coatomer adaptor adaptin-like N-terminal domain-containing protein n=1 Tax=Tritrichomonas foetus TaxID=1144522 RepID=A0A1J4KIL9_9EUKA|nr:hypothetical protein TRFO_04009 [Tritrichomonas foetus]|eukprot:OHT11075.1 hypothetical protein TRFO_04009 [Tritrichomonas foetus]
MYISTNDFLKLPFDNKDIGGLALSCLIPIFEKHPEAATTDLVRKLDSLIPSFPMKIVRLYSILCDFFTDMNVDWTVVDSLIMRAETFISNQAARPLIHSLFKLVSKLAPVREGRLKYILGVFVACLESSDSEIVLNAYNALIALKPPVVPVSSTTLINHLKNDNNAISLAAIQLLCFSSPEIPTKDLIECVLRGTRALKWAKIAILSLCRAPSVAHIMLSLSGFWLSAQSRLDETLQLQIILVILILPENRPLVAMNDDIPKFFDRIIKTQKIDYIETICSAIRRFPITPEFLARLSASNFVHDYLSVIIALNLDQVYTRGYLLLDKLCRFAFIPESLMFLEVAVRHLKECPNLQVYAMTFLTVLSNYPIAADEMTRLGVPQLLKNLQLSDDVATYTLTTLNNISNNTESGATDEVSPS